MDDIYVYPCLVLLLPRVSDSFFQLGKREVCKRLFPVWRGLPKYEYAYDYKSYYV